MVLPAIKEQILSDLGRLSPDLQRRALEFVQGLAAQAPNGASIDNLVELAGTLDEESAREMKDAIEVDCERIDPDGRCLLVNEGEEANKTVWRGRMAALAADLADDPRPFRDLCPEERSARIEKVMGVGRGLMSTSEEFARQKFEETELEDQKLTQRLGRS